MDDDELGARLRRSLEAEVPRHDGPSADRIASLRAEAAEHAAVSRRDRWPLRSMAAVLVLVAFVGGVFLALDPPGPVRDLARAIGLDVESSELVAAQREMDALGQALAVATAGKVSGDVSDGELAAVADADRSMLAAIAKLDDDERDGFVPTAHQVHLRAVELFVAEGRDLATAKPSDLEEIERGD